MWKKKLNYQISPLPLSTHNIPFPLLFTWLLCMKRWNKVRQCMFFCLFKYLFTLLLVCWMKTFCCTPTFSGFLSACQNSWCCWGETIHVVWLICAHSSDNSTQHIKSTGHGGHWANYETEHCREEWDSRGRPNVAECQQTSASLYPKRAKKSWGNTAIQDPP